jgi:hypothetical protein
MALAAVFDRVATDVVDRVVKEAERASAFFGLSGNAARRYGERIRGLLPTALDTLTEPTPEARDRKMDELVVSVRKVSDDHHVPRIIERGLVSIAFDVARRMVRDRAADSGFTAEELDAEVREFRESFESRLYRT